jgi:hypothetical protein
MGKKLKHGGETKEERAERVAIRRMREEGDAVNKRVIAAQRGLKHMRKLLAAR